MEDQRMMKKTRIVDDGDDDRISKLSDDLIHQIMSFMDTRFIVQTSVLSKRWKFVWTTLPFLIFNGYEKHYFHKKLAYSKFLNNFFSRRNHQSRILKLDIVRSDGLDLRLMKKYVKYGISHNVERLSVKKWRGYCSLSMFSSKSLKELELRMKFEDRNVMESDCWTLPNLTTLFLADYNYYVKPKFPESCLTCLPALTTLGLDQCELPEFFSLPSLTTLCLENCTLPKNVWDFPALLTLQLSNVTLPKNMIEYFRVLANLRNLAIDFGRDDSGCCVISSSQLVNLEIKAPVSIANASVWKVEVLAPKLCNFSAVGLFSIAFEDSGLENVNIKFQNCTNLTKMETLWLLKHRQNIINIMFSGLGGAKILAPDLVTLQVLNEITDNLVLRSPFPNLKYLKLPYGCKESDISSSVRQYLLGGSPHATIVKTLSRDDVISQMAPAVSVLAQNVVLEEPLVNPTKKLADSLYTHGKTCSDTVAMRVPKEHMVNNFLVDYDKVQQIEGPAARKSNDQASSSWRLDHEVNSEFVGLLDLLKKRYPETFEQLPTENKKILTVKLNMLCCSVNAFTKTYMTEVDTKLLAEYRALFTDLQRWGFNINWLMSRLNYVEQLHLSNPLRIEHQAIDSGIDNVEGKLKDRQNLHAEMMTDRESFQTTSTSHAATACYIGDGLL